MSAKEPQRAIDLLIEIKNENIQIFQGISQLLLEIKEVKRINDEQLTELKRGRPE